MAQLLADVIALWRRTGKELWLVSFDIEKAYDSIPWLALFGVMRQAGIAENAVRVFEFFYQHLQRCFRYGQVDGGWWRATNSLMQGCPAAPDQLNILMEPFHRWAAVQTLGVLVAGKRVVSVSFADDIALVAGNRAEAVVLVDA